MIEVITIWQRINQYASKYQSGVVVADTFNAALAETQLEIYNDLSQFYQVNEKVRGLLNPWVKVANTPVANGVIDMATVVADDEEFDRVVAMGVTSGTSPYTSLYEINPITEGELVYVNRVPQRQPDLNAKRVYFLMDGATTINLAPIVSTLPTKIYYLIFPTEAHIAFTYTVTDDEDIMTYDAGDSVNLAWTKDAENIIIYKMLQKYGITSRDSWIAEYSRLGIDSALFMQQGGKS